jgi:uncharacterized protein YrzB (UPF0473 family)
MEQIEQEGLANVVVLIDEDGREVEFDHLITVEYQGRAYVALMPMEEVEGIAEDEVLMLRIETDETGEDHYVPVEDEKLLETVFELAMEQLEEEEEEDEE